MQLPELFVLAGCNGAGKSTCASVILPEKFRIHHFVNADLIAESLDTRSPIKAGRIMLQQLWELKRSSESFAFETTLAGRNYATLLRDCKQSGYLIHLAFIWLKSSELAKNRVTARVRRGGHDIPDHVIERRYHRGLANFFNLYRSLADTWVLCDNSGSDLVVVARGGRHVRETILHPETVKRIRDGIRPREQSD